LDSPESAGSCLQLPPQEESLYAHFFGRVGSDDPNAPNPPFPLQVVLDSEGLIVHIGQSHQPDLIVQKLRELLTP
jgi:hypothetical protein